MSLLSLDSSFQNPSQNRHGSLANITSSIHSSPKSNRNTLKPNSNSKSIEKPPNNRNNSSTKKAPLAKTPQKYTNRDNFSPIPLSKRSIPRNDANPDFKRSYDPSYNRVPPPRDPTLKRSSSKPLANISMCSSRVSSNLTHSDLRQSTFDKLNESIEALAKSALAESLYQAKEMPPRGSQSSSRKPAPTKSREPEVSSFSASGSKNQTLNMSGSKRNIMNSQNTSFVMQKVYSVNNKALNLTNLLTRPRSREDLSSRHPVLTSASRKDVKENDPKFTPIRQSLDHSSSSSSKLNMQKRLSEPAVKSKGLEVRNLNTSNIQETPYIPSSLVKSLIGGHNTSTNLGDITKITEKDESSHFCIGDKTVSFGDCNQTLSHYIKTEEKDDNDHELALNSLKERFDVFVGTISTVLDEAAFREKRSFFIKLLTMVHAHKVKLSKFLASQEQNKKAFYFGLWNQALGQQSQHDYTQTSMICEKEAGIDQMLEEAQLSTAISFHSNKLLKKYFYQGFLGHYVVCKLGPEEQQLLPEPIIKQDNNKRSKSPSMRPSPTTPQDKRKSFPTTNQRSKTPTNSQSLNIANFNLKPTSTRKFTPTDRSFRSQTCLTSPNQSFIKGTKYPPKGSKGTKEIMSASVLDQSFGCENPKTLLTEELIPDQIFTKIPQPQKKEGLETLRFDTPRRMNTRNNTLESTERSLKSSTTTGSNIKSRIPTQNRFGNSPSCQQPSQKKKPQEKIPEKKEFTKVLKKKYEPSRRETETTPPPLRQKPRSNSNLKRTEEKTVSSFTKAKGTRASYEEDDFFEVSEYNEQKALAFRKKKLTQLYGQKLLTILVTTTNRKIQAAWFLRIRNLLRKGLLGLLEAVECQDTQKSIEEIKEEEHSEDNSEEESEEEESENMKMMMNIAKEHYETNVKINVFNNLLEYFVQSHEEGKVYAQYRDNSLKRSCFSKWFEVLPKLKEEDEKFEHAYEAIIQKFRFIMLTEKALRQWRNYIAEGGKDQSDE